jgi:hypothetical protein
MLLNDGYMPAVLQCTTLEGGGFAGGSYEEELVV